MPSVRVTVALNTKQSQKAPLLIPASASNDPASTASIRGLVVKTAQTKLRLRKPTRIFASVTGAELLSDEDWECNVKNDVVLLVSAGEEYVGNKKDLSIHVEANPDCPVTLLASKAPVEPLSVAQLTTTAHTLPGIVHAVGQPDLHPGTKFPIGAVFASKKWIHPPLIGSDIGCGMAWYKTTLSRKQVDRHKGRKVAQRLVGLEGPWRNQPARQLWLQDGKENYSAGEEWDVSLGTIGAGNHFVEIQVVEESSLPESDIFGLKQHEVVLLVHSGSRGYGGSVLEKFSSNSHVSLEEDSQEAIEYMKDHDKACQWAKANRDLIALRFLACLEPGNEDWRMDGLDADQDDAAATLNRTKRALQQRKVVDMSHNHVERVKWPPTPLANTSTSSTRDFTEKINKLRLHDDDTSKQEYVHIHRKGAAPCLDPCSHTPLQLLPLPGSRGTPTLMLQPTMSEATCWGLKNALSLAHGAGRAMSRAKALTSLSQKYRSQNILEPRASDVDGTWVICEDKDLVFEEAPDAYKNVEAVGQDLVDAGVAQMVGWCRARVSYKVRNEGR